jgi:hypothetical protein
VQWVQLSKNRDRILRVIATIETKLAMPANKPLQPTTEKRGGSAASR